MSNESDAGAIRLTRRTAAYWRVTIDIPPLNIFGPANIPQLEKVVSSIEEDERPLAVALDRADVRLHHRIAFTKLVRIVEVGEVAASEPRVGVDERLDDLGVDLVPDVALALEGDHVLEARALGNCDRWSEVAAVSVLVGDVLDEQHE